MRKKNAFLTIALATGLSAALMIPPPIKANATGNVLLPSETTNNNAQPPNLGLMPRAPLPSGTQQATPNYPPHPTVPQQLAPQIEIKKPSANATTSAAEPPPSKSLASELLTSISPTKNSLIPQQMQPSIINHGSTIIIKTTTPPPLAPEVQKILQSMPNYDAGMSRLAVNISNQSVWGPSDVDKVMNKLGMARNKVVESCILSLRGMIIAENGVSQFNTKSNGKDDIKYSGKIKKIMAEVQALCPTTESVPSGKGIIHQIDNKFAVHLGIGNCNPRLTSPPQELIITYAGNGMAQCDYK
ncbi:MAG: hypothetical protein ABTQ34_02600 [Bdellovibrionales bacterium]